VRAFPGSGATEPRLREAALGAALAALLADCSTLPTAGPTVHELLGQAVANNRAPFDINDVDMNVVATLLTQPRESFAELVRPSRGGITAAIPMATLVSSPAENHLCLAGRCPDLDPGAPHLLGPRRSRTDCPASVEQRLADKAIEPAAIVTVANSVSNTAAVSGEVISGSRLRLSLKGDRPLDLITEAGGAKAAVYQTFQRGEMTLVEALAKAGGLIDQRSDPAGVFLFRYEPAVARPTT
jgi:polysaccharide export outer membrane protein